MNVLKDNIKRLGWTQVQLAERLGTTKQSLNNTLTNDGIPLSKVRQIADIIGCSIIDLLQEGTTNTTDLFCPHCGKPVQIETKISAK